MNDPITLSLVLGAVGTVISALAMLVVSLIGFLVRYFIQTHTARLDKVEAKNEANATKIVTHGEQLSAHAAKTENEQKSLDGLWDAIDGIRTKLDEMLGHLRRNGSVTPTRVHKVDPRAER